jgi:hypothetical protein
MRIPLHSMPIVLLAAGVLQAAPPARPPMSDRSDAVSEFEFGNRPPSPVFDPGNVLKPATVGAIGKELDSIRTIEGVDVLVVVIKDLKGAPPEHMARRFAEAWCAPLFHCVVLHSPGDPAGPWIIPGGKLLKRFAAEPVKHQIADACRRAALEPNDDRKVSAAATEASEMLRIWLGDNAYWAYQYQQSMQVAQHDMIRKDKIRRILLPGAAVCGVFLLGFAALVHQWYRLRRPLEFPQPRWQRRLGAPYAGGNDSTLRLSHGAAPSQTADTP